jgi:hypothetical protein
MFLDHLKTKGNKTIRDAIIAIKAVFKLDSIKTNEITKAAIPIATFKP